MSGISVVWLTGEPEHVSNQKLINTTTAELLVITGLSTLLVTRYDLMKYVALGCLVPNKSVDLLSSKGVHDACYEPHTFYRMRVFKLQGHSLARYASASDFELHHSLHPR
jgi:hypothetical protein